MPLLHALVLGIVQGATELLPVSSSAHLELTRWLLGWDTANAEVEKAFDVAVHIGTLLAIVGMLRDDVLRITRSCWNVMRRRSGDRLPGLLLLATVPAAVTGALLEDVVVDRAGEPWLIGVTLIVFGIALGVADRARGMTPLDRLDLRSAIVIGTAQALALQPGVSRSGATISAARALGFARDDAARLSFLLGIPLIAGAGLFEATNLARDGVDASFAAAMLVGASAAGITAGASVSLLLRVVRRGSFLPFVVYRVALGAVVLVVVLSGAR